MISKNGTTWTDPDETHEYHEKFKTRFPGEKIGEPCCQRCGKTTCYIVDDVEIVERKDPFTKKTSKSARFRAPGRRIFAANLAFFLDESMAFFPIQECTACGATDSGFQAGHLMGHDLAEKELLTDRARRNITEEEFPAWQKAFNIAFLKGTAAFNAEKAKRNKKGSANKYMPKTETAPVQQEL